MTYKPFFIETPLSGQMLVYQHEKYLDIQEEEIVTAMQETTTRLFRKHQKDVRILFE